MLFRSYQWQVGDEVRCCETIWKVTGFEEDELVLDDGYVGSQKYWEQQGYTLHRKASEIEAAEAEPYQWQVGDIIACGTLHREIKEIDRAMALPWIIFDDGSRQSQTYWEASGHRCHRKASEIQPTISDSVGANGEGQS